MLSVLEFYSGIGGLHLALKRANSTTCVKVLRAFDWDPSASEVYSHNFGGGIVNRCDILSLNAIDLLPYEADMWLLSPACQPYTVLNPNAKGETDPRAKSFLHLMTSVLPELVTQRKGPRCILVENVAGFETSTTRQVVLKTLESLQYYISEFLLTPLQFGIPNSRLRYYLLARRDPFHFLPSEDIHSESDPRRSIPNEGPDWIDPRLQVDDSVNYSVLPLRNFLDEQDYPSSSSPYAIPKKILRSKHAPLFDIVKPCSTRTCCFTRGYTHMIEGSSILQQAEDLDTTDTFNAYAIATASDASHKDNNDPLELLLSLHLRYFTPTELLRLFCFNLPPNRVLSTGGPAAMMSSYEAYLSSSRSSTRDFTFPDTTSLKTRYRLIGNSVNVYVVSKTTNYEVSQDTLRKMCLSDVSGYDILNGAVSGTPCIIDWSVPEFDIRFIF
ncbi:hypothetical protein Clacol_003177 [Clathrus columnatus]|uniref:S-adenosyl-L-methionine-dependent methyltransferase n=1 Tax=Clathrus columnatus TaxID=1419009 RepID=A0AAV5A2U6_9AGAM|nr:hypothetical protein Clacol_003177 [Clathrus columnatus]